jgi:hypothetical protein
VFTAPQPLTLQYPVVRYIFLFLLFFGEEVRKKGKKERGGQGSSSLSILQTIMFSLHISNYPQREALVVTFWSSLLLALAEPVYLFLLFRAPPSPSYVAAHVAIALLSCLLHTNFALVFLQRYE